MSSSSKINKTSAASKQQERRSENCSTSDSKTPSRSESKKASRSGSTKSPGSVRKRVRKSLVIVGDGMIGKSCLLSVFIHKEFYENYQPTVFENCCVDIDVGEDIIVDLTIHDTAGQSFCTTDLNSN